MITIDSRSGSGDMQDLFPKEVPTMVSTIDFADFFFLGNGPDSSYVTVGIERKAILDLVSSMATGRFSGHQLPGLLQQYDYVYLLVEGVWRYDPDSGILETLKGAFWTDVCLGQRRFMAKEVVGFLNTIMVKTGVHVLYSTSRRESAQIITSLYHWWNDKNWGSHTSHLSQNKIHKGAQGEIQLTKPSLVRRVAAEISMIGWGKSLPVSEHFPSVLSMVMADEKEWMKIDGIGPKIAKTAVEELHKEE